MIDALRGVVDALNAGDPEPLAALMADDSEWQAVPEGHLWWKSTPSCHGPGGALQAMRAGMRRRAARSMQLDPTFEPVGDDTVIASSEWTEDDGRRTTRYMVFTFRDGRIVRMQGSRSRRDAERLARRSG